MICYENAKGGYWSWCCLYWLVVGCAAPAYVEKDDTADFSRYRTYAWVETKSSEGKDRPKNDLLKNMYRKRSTPNCKKKGGC